MAWGVAVLWAAGSGSQKSVWEKKKTQASYPQRQVQMMGKKLEDDKHFVAYLLHPSPPALGWQFGIQYLMSESHSTFLLFFTHTSHTPSLFLNDFFVLGWWVAVRGGGLIAAALYMACYFFVRWRRRGSRQTWCHRHRRVLHIESAAIWRLQRAVQGPWGHSSSFPFPTAEHHAGPFVGVRVVWMWRRVPVHKDSGKATSVAIGQVAVLRVCWPPACGFLQLAAPDKEERNDNEKGYTQQRYHHVHGIGTSWTGFCVVVHGVHASHFPELHLRTGRSVTSVYSYYNSNFGHYY